MGRTHGLCPIALVGQWVASTDSVFHRLIGRHPSRRTYGTWVYHLLVEVVVEAGLQELETYVALRQNTVAQYIATRPNMDLFLAAEQPLRDKGDEVVFRTGVLLPRGDVDVILITGTLIKGGGRGWGGDGVLGRGIL